MFYNAIFTEYGITGLDSKDLDAGWVSAVDKHLQNLKDGKLTENEISVRETELIDLFISKQDEEDDPENAALKEQNRVKEEEIARLKNINLMNQAEKDVSVAPDIITLEKLKATYKDLPDALKLIDDRINELNAIKGKQRLDSAEAAVASSTDLLTLEKLRETYQDLPDILKLIDDRILIFGVANEKKRRNSAKDTIAKGTDVVALEKMKTDWNQDKEIVKLVNARVRVVKEVDKQSQATASKQSVIDALAAANGRRVTYDFLKKLGITPTGDDMVVYGIKLTRQYYFHVYQVDVPK